MQTLTIRNDHLKLISGLAQTCKDETRISLYKTVLVEKYERDTISITATNGHVLFHKVIIDEQLCNDLDNYAESLDKLEDFHSEGIILKFDKKFNCTKKEEKNFKTLVHNQEIGISYGSYPRYRAVIPCEERFKQLEPSKVWTHFNLSVFEELLKGIKLMGHTDFKFFFRDDLGPLLLQFNNCKDIAVIMPAKKDY